MIVCRVWLKGMCVVCGHFITPQMFHLSRVAVFNQEQQSTGRQYHMPRDINPPLSKYQIKLERDKISRRWRNSKECNEDFQECFHQ